MNPYTNYYINQVGTGLPGFQRIRYQRGHGFFGSIFSCTLLPFFKQLLPAIGKRAILSALGLAQDVLDGENVGKLTLSRLKEVGKNVAEETLDQLKTRVQKGSAIKRKNILLKIFKKGKLQKLIRKRNEIKKY